MISAAASSVSICSRALWRRRRMVSISAVGATWCVSARSWSGTWAARVATSATGIAAGPGAAEAVGGVGGAAGGGAASPAPYAREHRRARTTTGTSDQMARGQRSLMTGLWPEGPHGLRDVLAHPGHRATVRGGERVVAVVRRGLAHGCATHARLAVPVTAHRPHRIQCGRLAGRRL